MGWECDLHRLNHRKNFYDFSNDGEITISDEHITNIFQAWYHEHVKNLRTAFVWVPDWIPDFEHAVTTQMESEKGNKKSLCGNKKVELPIKYWLMFFSQHGPFQRDALL